MIDGFGQDASVRASAGWLAGNGMYGYDPIQKFAEEIEDMKERNRIKATQIGCDGACKRTGRECSSCFYKNNPTSPGYRGTYDGLQSDNEMGNVGPEYERHPPYFNELDGYSREGYESPGGDAGQCTSCMSTEEFDNYQAQQ